MDELMEKRETVLDTLNITHIPVLQDTEVRLASAQKLPIERIAAIGVGFEPLASAIQSIVKQGTGGSGLYWVDTQGKQMFMAKNGSGFIGSLKNTAGTVGGGQARMTQLACNPAMLFMAAALVSIEKKLDTIQKLQEEMMDFLKAKEKAKLRGNLNVLNDVMNNYKFNITNEKYIINKHILVQDIRKDAEESIQLFRDQISKQLAVKGLFHGDHEVKTKLRKLQDEFKDYQLSLYLFAYAGFLEIILLENFNSQYLDGMVGRIKEYTEQFRDLYTKCYDKIESMSKSSVESMITKGFAGITGGTGKIIAKIPVISNGSVDEALISAGSKLESLNGQKTENAMKSLADAAYDCTLPFVENILAVNRAFNKPMDIMFDENDIYFLPIENS